MTKSKQTNGETTINKALHIQLMIELTNFTKFRCRI